VNDEAAGGQEADGLQAAGERGGERRRGLVVVLVLVKAAGRAL
jgi:hypothetical protein